MAPLPDLFPEIQAAEARIRPHVLTTPLEHSPVLSEQTGADVWLKLECLQTTGSFKLRGAANKILWASPEQRARGIVTASTGNHGTAVAHMLDRLGAQGTIFVPQNVSVAKVASMRRYANVRLHYHGQDCIATEEEARRQATEQGLLFVSPYNDLQVVAGQGTIGLELMQQLPTAEVVYVPVGGGGLVSGIAGYLKAVRPQTRVIGCQPHNSAVMYASVQAGKVLDLPSGQTLSDGTAGGIEADTITLAYCQQYVDEFVLLSEAELRRAWRLVLEAHCLLVEGAAALSVAALLKQGRAPAGKQVVLILCGRKMKVETIRELLAEEEGPTA